MVVRPNGRILGSPLLIGGQSPTGIILLVVAILIALVSAGINIFSAAAEKENHVNAISALAKTVELLAALATNVDRLIPAGGDEGYHLGATTRSKAS